ncbi:MAG: LysM peptidoglycan-binding domain-containing protein [Acidimicrobiales bacterium]
MQVRALAVAASIAALAAVAIWWPAAVAAETYVVEEGDSLGVIAARAGVSTSRLAALNGIADPDRIYPGQILSTNEPAKHTVRSGETLSGIAARNGLSTAYLAGLNGIGDPNAIYEGQTLATSGPLPVAKAVAMGIRCPVPGASFVNDFGYVRPDSTAHAGVDLFAARGTPVVAPVAGLVAWAPNPSGGNAFQFYGDDGIRYYGAHLDRYGRNGYVGAGAVIGYVGNTGDAVTTSPHLHFEMHPGSGLTMSPYPSLYAAC